jgi:light-regulated signal transduction histidine kinase (bacteriophytochrome)
MQSEQNGIMHKMMSGEKIYDLESKRITKQGKLIDVLFSATVISDPSESEKSIAITERDITQHKFAHEQIRLLNLDLQKNIAQLEVANKELESFSYSVSHDLRAPLRIMDGYSQILQEDYSNSLEKEAKDLLKNIRGNAKRMGVLIDDLLAFSKLGKQEVQKSNVDMQTLVQDVVRELQAATNQNVNIKLNQLLPASVDSSLIRQVWSNLISNAVKYTSKSEKPVIEIGSRFQNNEIIYYVKDNGAGFSMEYVHKLFKVFQRLHRQSEFEGTGIGLAIVYRIISKHHGKVWAEGELNKGATFYFTLPAA